MVLDCASALLMASDRHGPCRGSSVWNAEAFPCLEVLPELVIIAELPVKKAGSPGFNSYHHIKEV